jgi:hypothetical protein
MLQMQHGIVRGQVYLAKHRVSRLLRKEIHQLTQAELPQACGVSMGEDGWTSRERRSPTEGARSPPSIPDHEMLRRISAGGYGEVWLARNIMGVYRAVKVVRRDAFPDARPYERGFEGIQKFEPISRRHENQVEILRVGQSAARDYFHYVMELADDASGRVGDVAGYVPDTLKQRLLQSQHLPFAGGLTPLRSRRHGRRF